MRSGGSLRCATRSPSAFCPPCFCMLGTVACARSGPPLQRMMRGHTCNNQSSEHNLPRSSVSGACIPRALSLHPHTPPGPALRAAPTGPWRCRAWQRGLRDPTPADIRPRRHPQAADATPARCMPRAAPFLPPKPDPNPAPAAGGHARLRVARRQAEQLLHDGGPELEQARGLVARGHHLLHRVLNHAEDVVVHLPAGPRPRSLRRRARALHLSAP